MRIAVLNESAAADRNADIMAALEGRGHEIINAGMRKCGEDPSLLYTHTGLATGLLMGLGRVDFVVGGCGTGQGYFNAAVQYPGVFCGHIQTPLDACLFAQINAGNCVSLTLTQGYGWAADINLRMIFDALFSVEWGGGYPVHRREPQKAGRVMLSAVSIATHRPWAEIIDALPQNLINPVLAYPGMLNLLDIDTIVDSAVRSALQRRVGA
jgi:ribose 5-phosphate isomerase RpiB